MDELEKIQIYHPFDRPFPFTRKVGLPHCVSMMLRKVRLGIGMFQRVETKTCLLQHVLNILPRNLVAQVPDDGDDSGHQALWK